MIDLQQIARRGSSLVLVAMVGIFSTLLTTGLVICICHDGHISFESQCEPGRCCTESARVEAEGPMVVATATPHAHFCLDLAIEFISIRAWEAKPDVVPVSSQPEVNAVPVVLRHAVPIPVDRTIPADDRPLPAASLQARTLILTI